MASFDKYNISNISKINRYYNTPLKTVKENNEFQLKILKKSKDKNLNTLKKIKIDTKDSFNISLNNSNNITKNSFIKLPILESNSISTYSKMKQYKVFLPKHRDKKEISYEEQEKKIKNLLNKYAKTNNKRNKYLFEDNVMKKYNFERYLKLQSEAEIKFKPRYGDSSNLLVSYIKKVSNIRKKMVDDVLDDINKNTENRYNLEKPNIDFNFKSRDKTLIDNRWKNTFSLDENKKYFIKNLKGKISDMSYLNMVKKFKKISLICFSEGNLNRASIKRLDNVN